MLAPIIVFAYNRANHLEQTLSALSSNEGAKDSKVFVFVDGPKSEAGRGKNQEVLQVAQKYEAGFFGGVKIVAAPSNKGLAKSVISGVTQIIEEYGKVIVVEDDVITSPRYLRFMNDALDFYEQDEKIWSVGGFTVPMTLPEYYDKSVIMTQRVSSCAWGTWRDRWEKIDWTMPDYKKFRFDLAARKKFNCWGDDRAAMLDYQMNGRINSWAIRFDYYMFKNEMYNVIPRTSLVRNIGFDGSGTHCAKTENRAFGSIGENTDEFVFGRLAIDENIRKQFVRNFQTSIPARMHMFLGNLLYRRR